MTSRIATALLLLAAALGGCGADDIDATPDAVTIDAVIDTPLDSPPLPVDAVPPECSALGCEGFLICNADGYCACRVGSETIGCHREPGHRPDAGAGMATCSGSECGAAPGM